MNKAQLVAVLLAGTAVGVGGKQLIETVTGAAEAAAAKPTVHAMDLRRERRPDAGVRITAYGWVSERDGGLRDIGQARSCKTPANAEAFMNSLSCEW